MHKHSSEMLLVLTALLAVLAPLLAGLVACERKPPPSKPQQPAESSPMLEYQAVGDAALGVASEILATGELAGNGTVQILAIQGEPTGDSAQRKIWRAALMEKRGDRWQELLRADQHLKNGNGYLGATPAEGAAGWMLRLEQGSRGTTFFFTPLAAGGVSRQPIPVRWNRAVGRYQAMDATGKRFLPDRATLGPVEMDLRPGKR